MAVQVRRVYKKKLFSLCLLLLPSVLLLFVFQYLPMYGIVISFQDFSPYLGIQGSHWVGFKQFNYFLHDPTFWVVMRNTLIINLYDIVFGFTAPILFALLANELMQKAFKSVVQSISYMPHFFSWIVVSGVFYSILSPETGMLNELLGWFGIDSVYFMAEERYFRGIVIFADIWKNVGWSAILYFAVIAGIDKSLYEAAMIDGAGRVRQIRHITLPAMYPMIILLLLLKISTIFSIGFERLFTMQNPLVYSVSDVISTYIYRLGLEKSQFSLTTAIGLVQSLLGFVLLLAANKLSKRISGMGLY
ncbi:ABC transporter permease [Paenibacillus cymbidii]|uniref:ABC transporter permease n=1 Tax=Paenibacillus cymbidii TaxID=1639034 RepID=UPI001080EF67|nr:ABC transporter permease subunit [Paenibacillus cymbidii]